MAGKRKNEDGTGSVTPKKRPAQEAEVEGKPAAQRNVEEDFPRGGASALTPAEIREAREEADAEFEKEKGKKNGKKRGDGKKGKRDAGEDDEFHGSILSGNLQKSAEFLRYKSLVVGMKIWGAIAEINKKDMIISLPGGLRGFVLAEDASEVFENAKASNNKGKKQKKGGKKTEDNESDPVDLDKEAPHLSDLFSLGQLVACSVRKLELIQVKKGRGKTEKEGKNEKKGRRIGLSLRLNYIYDGLSIESVYEGQVLSAVVTSIEDHGYLLSFGVPALSGFLLHSNYMDGKESFFNLRKGHLVQGVVISVDKKRGAVGLKVNPGLVASNMVKEFVGLTVELLTPGAMVNARVRKVLKNGLLLSFLTYFTGTVDIFHLENPLPGADWSKIYSENQRLKARILYIDPVAKTIGLTLNPQLLNNAAPAMAMDVGHVLKDAVVRRVDATVGMLLELPTKETPVAGYVHISNVSDEHIAKLEKKYKVGKKVQARVIGHRVMDALSIVSLKKSVVEQHLLSHADVKSAMSVAGTVVAVEAYGAFVQLADGVKALCPLQHMSEFQRSTPSSKFQVGARLKFRVLTSDPETKKIALTHKKTMVTSKLSPIVSYEDAVEGLVTHGFITGVEDIGCFVTFYNEVRGLVHKSALGLEAGAKAENVFQVGQCVKCRVLRSDPSARRLSLSFITTSFRDNASEGEADDVKPGKIVAGTVAHVSDGVLILDISTAKGSVKGYLAFPHLSDNLGHVDQLKAVMKVGLQFDQLLILEVTENQKLIVSAKYSLLQAASSLPSDISQLQPQSVIPGYIANITDRGCFVRFLGHLTGLANIPQVADEFVSDPNNHFKVGQSVRAQVLEVHHDTGKFSLCLKQSVCFSTDGSLIHSYFLEEEKIVDLSGVTNLEWTQSLAIGTCTDGEVQEVKDYGVIVKIPSHKDVVGFVTHYQVGDPVEVGKPVQARVLDVVKPDGIVDLTLRPELLQVSQEDSTKNKKEKKKKRLNPATALELHQKVAAVVELVKDTYLVLSLPEQGNAIGFAAAGDYNSQQQDSHQFYKPGQRVVASVENLGDKASGQRLLLLLCKSDDSPQIAPQSAKKARKESKKEKEIGTVVDAEVVAIEKLQLIVRVGSTMEGRVHITEIMDRFEDGNPLSSFTVGQNVKGRVVQKVRVVKTPGSSEHSYIWELSLRPSQLLDTSETEVGNARPRALPSIKEIVTGQVIKAYVQETKDNWAWLVVAPHLRGRLFLLDSSSDPSELEKFSERFSIGTAVSCRVKAIDYEKQTLDFILREAPQEQEKSEFHVPPIEGEGALVEKDQKQDVGFQKGDVLGGRVARINPGVGGLSIQIAPAVFGRVHVTHLSDVWKDDPVAGFKEGQFVRCVVLEVSKSFNGKTHIDLTLRKSLGGLAAAHLHDDTDTAGSSKAVKINSIKDLEKDLEVQGFVKIATSKGCFVILAPAVDARVLISNLSNTFVQEPAESFPPGKLVTGRILSVDPLSGRVEMTLKTSNKTKRSNETKKSTSNLLGRSFKDFKEGEVVFGIIKRIEKFGIFVTIEQSSVVALCHVSEIADHFVKDVEKHYKVGDRVRARVLKVDTSKERISIGLKESYFLEPVSEVGMEVTNEQATNVTSVDDAEESGEDDKDEDSKDEEDLMKIQGAQSDDGEGEDESEEENGIDLDGLDEDDEEENESEDDIPETGAATLTAPPLEVQLEEESHLDNDSEEEEEEEESEDAKKLTKRAKKRLKAQREAEITAAEEKRLKGDQAPETVDEFEALVRTSPNSSLVWIKYMAFLVQLADVDKARAIAERALQTINYREEGEKLNVWIAYLNLENVYGNPPKEAVFTLFNRALQYNDQKKLYFAMLGIYENPRQLQGPQHDMVNQLLKTMTRKFNTSAKVWLRQIQSLLARGMGDAAHKALDQSLLSLPRRKHIKVISRAALLEFKTGSVERARSIFEGILRNYPKRVDLWSVYLDQEIRVGEVPVIRALFERVICLELPPRKMKFLFKKYLDYEKAHGDEERIEHVKRKAMEYVDTKLG